MTGSLFAPLPLAPPSPVRPVAPSYSIDSFYENSTQIVTCSSTPAASGSQSARAKEEDEELFRDLFAGENDTEANEDAPVEYKPTWSAAPTFLPQKPAMRRAPSLTGNPNPRHHLTPMRPAPPQPVLSTPFIPRLKLEELVNARPDDDDDNNNSPRTFRRGSELEQVTEEDEYCFDNGPSEGSDGKSGPRKTQLKTRDQGFNSSLGFSSNNQRFNNDKLDQETLRFLEKLDLKAVLHTPRPDLLSFYPGIATTPTTKSMVSPYSKVPANLPEDGFMENDPAPKEERIGLANEKSDIIYREPPRVFTVDGVSSRLAYMESAYGTAPIVRKTRRQTINRLANPISGHTSTLQALSPKLREKREAALTGRAPLSPISAAIAVTCRRGTTSKKGKTATLFGGIDKSVGNSEIPVAALATVKRKAVKPQDPLVHKRRSNMYVNPQTRSQGPTVSGLTKRKSKTALGCRSLVARKEALKKKLQSRPGATKRGGDGKIGGATFLTQRDDEDGIELIEEFITRNRGAAGASLTFRYGNKVAPRRAIPALPSRKPMTARTRPQPPQNRSGVPFARVSGASKVQGAHTGRALDTVGNLSERRNEKLRESTCTARSEADHQRAKIYQHPRRPQAWQTTSTIDGLTGRPTTPRGVTNPLRKLKVHPAMPTLLARAPKTPPSAAAMVLMGSIPFSSLSVATANELKSARVPRQGTKKPLTRKTNGNAPRVMATMLDAPTKISEQRKRTSITARSKGGGKTPTPRHSVTVRRATSRL